MTIVCISYIMVTMLKFFYQQMHFYLTYRVIQEKSAILWEMIVCVILSIKVHTNMGPILDGYGVMIA